MFSLPHEIHTCFLHVNKHIRGWERCSYPRNRFCNTHRANLPCETMSLSRHGVWLMYSESQAGAQLPKELSWRPETAPGEPLGRCGSPTGRETQAPCCLAGRKTKVMGAGPRWLACSSTVPRDSKVTPDHHHQEFAQSYLEKPKLWGGGRAGFCQDKYNRVREMLAWLISAT